MNIYLLQAQQSSGPFGGMTSIIFMGMIILVFWMFFIRPQAKRQKQQHVSLTCRHAQHILQTCRKIIKNQPQQLP